jgi:hypothetical protein
VYFCTDLEFGSLLLQKRTNDMISSGLVWKVAARFSLSDMTLEGAAVAGHRCRSRFEPESRQTI